VSGAATNLKDIAHAGRIFDLARRRSSAAALDWRDRRRVGTGVHSQFPAPYAGRTAGSRLLPRSAAPPLPGDSTFGTAVDSSPLATGIRESVRSAAGTLAAPSPRSHPCPKPSPSPARAVANQPSHPLKALGPHRLAACHHRPSIQEFPPRNPDARPTRRRAPSSFSRDDFCYHPLSTSSLRVGLPHAWNARLTGPAITPTNLPLKSHVRNSTFLGSCFTERLGISPRAL